MKVLLTGGTGAAGQYVLQTLMTTNHEVRVLALPDSLHRLNFRDRIEIVLGDVADETALREATSGVDLVFHTALVRPTPTMPRSAMDAVNVAGTRRLVEAAAPSADRIVLVTSAAVYADHAAPASWPVTDASERYPSGGPLAMTHAESLIAAEDVLMESAARHRTDFAILRPTLIGGRKARAIEWMVALALRAPERLGDLHRFVGPMQWVHGSDVGTAAMLLGEEDAARNGCFLAAGAEPLTAFDLQALVWSVLNVGRDDNPHARAAHAAQLGLPKYASPGLAGMGWRPRTGPRDIIVEALGRLEFETSESLRLPTHLVHEGVDAPEAALAAWDFGEATAPLEVGVEEWGYAGYGTS